MKSLHRSDLFCWSVFDEAGDLDFNSYLWKREGGNLVIDPLPLCQHDRAQIAAMGGLDWIVLTTSAHLRDAVALAEATGAQLAGPAGESESFPVPCQRWLGDGDELVPGLRSLTLMGSQTPGELALILEETTLITGHLVRAPVAGRLAMLSDTKLQSRPRALRTVQRLAMLPRLETVLVAEGWSVFHRGGERLRELAESLKR